MTDTDFYTGWNSFYPRCVDGRPCAAIIAWQNNTWQVIQRGDDARAIYGPQFLGGALMFVRALEVVAGRGRWRAFDYVERALEEAGFAPQIHIDNDLGQRDLAVMTDAALIDLARYQHTGCGYAAFAWGRHTHLVINEAKRRGWRIQLLSGPHTAQIATINYRLNETSDTAAANAAHAARFNLDAAEARPVFVALETMIRRPGFARDAEVWMLSAYREVLAALGGRALADSLRIRPPT
jgi:hypothetical protein